MRRLIIILLIFVSLTIINSCMRDHSVVDPQETIDYRQYGIIVNKSVYHPYGIETLYINENDTLSLDISTILLNPPQYQWTVGDENILKLIPNSSADSTVLVVAVGDSGTTTLITLYDEGNDVTKTIPVIVSKYWADPEIFDFMGIYNSHYYYMSIHLKTWLEAKLQCEMSNGHLITINDENENEFLSESPVRGYNELWIGLTYLYNNMDLSKWITGEPATYKNFLDVGTGSGPGDFAEYYFYMNAEGKWQQWHEKTYHYVLEME